jgi:purine nucleosidase
LFQTRPGAIRVVCEGLALGQTIQKPDHLGFPPGARDNRRSHWVCAAVRTQALLDRYREAILTAKR